MTGLKIIHFGLQSGVIDLVSIGRSKMSRLSLDQTEITAELPFGGFKVMVSLPPTVR